MSRIIKSSNIIEISNNDKYEKKNKGSYLIEKEIEKIIEEAKINANKILKKAEEEREEVLKEIEYRKKISIEESKNIKDKAYEEGQKIGYEKGFNVGYEKSYSDGMKKIDEKIDEVLKLKDEYKTLKSNIISELEPDVINLVSEIVEKVIGNRIETDENYILELISNGIKNLDPTTTLTIITSKEDYKTVLKNKNTILAESSLIDELEIKYDINYKKGDCILETNRGNIDLSIEDQLEEVQVFLKEILNN